MWKKRPDSVVEMPHCGKTAFGTPQTPKKAAFARVFRFTFYAGHSKLMPR
jgi:hypothetical protein